MSLSEVVQKLVKVVNNLVDEVGDIEDKTAIYDDKIASLDDKVTNQGVYIDHINTEIDDINNTISELPTYDVIEDIRTDISNINSSVADLDTRVELLEGQNVYQRLATAEQNIANLGNDIVSINGDITDIQGDITDIQGDITDIQGDITDIQGDITDIDNRLNSLTLEDLSYVRYTSGDYISYPWSGYNNSNELVARMCQMIDANGGNIATLISDFFFDDDLSSGEYIDYPINQVSLSGHLTGSGKSVYIFIPFNKYLRLIDNSYSFSITGDITIRSINGYLRDSGNTYNFNNIDISAFNPQLYKTELGFRLVLTLSETASATNNTPITAYFSSNGKIRITVL